MSDQNTASVSEREDVLATLRTELRNESEKKQLQLVPKLVELGDIGLEVLREYLQENKDNPPNLVIVKAYQTLHHNPTSEIKEFLTTFFPNGVVPLKSERNIDYQPIQDLLINQDYQTADRVTLEKMCELAGETAAQRGWLYFTDAENFPSTDLQTLDQLWLLYSEGKFGFSVQRKLWRSLGQDFVKLWYKIGWKEGNIWTRYPKGFIWDLSAPTGHLPLSNQLRGVRVVAALLSHPAWTNTENSK